MADEALNIVIGVVDKASGKLQTIGAKIKKTGDSIARTGRQMTTSLTLPIALVAGAGVKAFAQFEKGLANINTLLDESDQPIGIYKDALLSLSKETPQSLDQLTEAMFFAVSAGKKGAEGIDLVTNSAKLATAGATDTATAIKAVNFLTRAYGEESISSAAAADLLFQINKKGVTTFEEVANAIGAPIPIANQLGVSQTELAAAFTTLVGTTGNADVVATQLKATFTGLQKPSEDLGKVISDLGFASAETLIAERGLNQSLKDIKKQAAASNIPLKALFNNVRATSGVMPLLTTLSGELDANMQSMADSIGAVDEAFEKQQETVTAQWQIFKNQLQVVLIQIGEIVLPKLIAGMDLLSSAFQRVSAWLDNLSPGWKDFIVNATLVVAAAGPILLIVGKMIALFGTLKIVLGGVAAAFSFLLANPIVLAIAAIVAAIALLILNWQKVKEVTMATWDFIVQHIDVAIRAIVGFMTFGLSEVVLLVINNWDIIKETFFSALTAISEFFTTIWEGITSFLEVTLAVFVGLLITFFDWLVPGWMEKFTVILNFFKKTWDLAKARLIKFFNTFKATYTKFMDAFKVFWTQSWEAVKLIFSNTWDSIKITFGEKWKEFTGMIMSGVELVKGVFTGMGSAIAQTFTGIWTGIKNVFLTGINFIIGKINFLIAQYNRLPFVTPIEPIALLPIESFQTGGIVPGVGSQDSVTARVSPGELILNKSQQANVARGLEGGGGPTIIVDTFVGTEEFAQQVGDMIMVSLKGGTIIPGF